MKLLSLASLQLALFAGSVAAFSSSSSHLTTTVPLTTTSLMTRTTTTVLHMAKKNKKKGAKGFGKASESGASDSSSASSATVSAPATAAATSASVSSAAPEQQQLNAGQRALAQLRRERAEQKDAELRRVRELMQEDQQVQETAAAIPEKVAQRMGKRMLPFVGIPLFGGMGSFVAFWYLATYKDMEFEPVTVAAVTIGVLVVGLLGITYSVMSASWDPDREGSALGTDEFSKNVENVREGLQRSNQNTLLRDKMKGLSGEELQIALKDLEQREAAAAKKKQQQASLQSKLQEELDG